MRACAAATLCLALPALAAGCGSSSSSNPKPPPAGSRYKPRVESTLVRACELGAGERTGVQSKCQCVLKYLEARISEHTLETTERAIARGEAKVPSWMRDAGLACRRA